MVTKLDIPKEGNIRCTRIGRTVGKTYTSSANTWNPGYKSIMETERHISDSIRKGGEVALSNGSLKYQWVTASLIIEGYTQGKHRIEASCTTPGLPRDQDAYISDIPGILHVLKIVASLKAKFNITEGSITLGWNGLDDIRMALDQFSSLSWISNHFDILTAINRITEEPNIIWRWRHVKVYQEDHMGPLYRRYTLNVLCTTSTKQLWEDKQALNYSQPRTVLIQNKWWRVFVDTPINMEGRRLKEKGVKISMNISKIIDQYLFRKPLLRRWSDINNVKLNQYK